MNTNDPNDLENKYANLLSAYRELTGEQLSIEARQVINILDTARDWVLPEMVASSVKVTVQRADFLLEKLVDSKHVQPSGFLPTKYRLTQKGRMAVHGTSA